MPACPEYALDLPAPFLLTQPTPEMLASQMWSYLKAFAFALPSAWNPLPQESTKIAPGSLHLSLSLSMSLYQTFICPCNAHHHPHLATLSSPLIRLSYVFRSPDHPQTSCVYLSIACSQTGSSGRKETILFTLFPKPMELWMTHGGVPINICCCCHRMLSQLPYIPFTFRSTGLLTVLYKKASLDKLTCTFTTRACFLWNTKEPREGNSFSAEMPVTSTLRNYTLDSPKRGDFFFLFESEKKECRNRVPSYYSLKGNFYEFYYVSIQNFRLSLTEGKNLRNCY